jgi:hypothetical protein
VAYVLADVQQTGQTHLQASLLEALTDGSLVRGFVVLDKTGGQTPRANSRHYRPAHQHHLAVLRLRQYAGSDLGIDEMDDSTLRAYSSGPPEYKPIL